MNLIAFINTANRHEFKELKAIHNLPAMLRSWHGTANRHEFKELKAIHNHVHFENP